jgi:hypothetical protein
MELWARITRLSTSLRELVAPSYRPEVYYMRGPGPAYRRRLAMLEGQRRGPRLGNGATPANS